MIQDTPPPPPPLPVPFASTSPTLTYQSAGGDDAPPPLTPENAHVLDKAAQQLAGVRLLRNSGRHDIFLGAIWLALGLMLAGAFKGRGVAGVLGGTLPPIVYAWLGFGTVLIACGVWICVRPNPLAMLLDGMVLLLLMAFNVWRLLQPNVVGRAARGTFSYVWPVILLVSAINRFRSLDSFREASANPVSPATTKWINALRKAMSGTHPKHDPTMVSLNATGSAALAMKGRFGGEVAVCLVNNARLRFFTRDQVQMSLLTVGPKWTTVALTVEGKAYKVRLKSAERARLGGRLPALATAAGEPAL